ncbi:hypothetical protein HMPREF0454_03140 [Hafnia alvei ATCC 51873]|uniref:Uncharacterized protein n=1 Tax=Hafnia alvei ATCC 51873 TaxID=1002364 RepID=G9Y9H2_HAFAL|nr:hypothetical protein HMPREF0454_03140 [Hafnia alvei ATCC 51873]
MSENRQTHLFALWWLSHFIQKCNNIPVMPCLFMTSALGNRAFRKNLNFAA